MPDSTSSAASPTPKRRTSPAWLVVLVVIMALGAYFRFVGLNWDDNQHLHPDERFMTMVSSAILPVNSLGDFFNTSTSTLNPNNVGYGFYVYGDLPLFITRYIAEAVSMTGYDQVNLVGRVISGVMDLLTILLVYLISLRLFESQRIALIAAAFDALSVLPIQLSHFYTSDVPANFFIFLAFYVAIRIQTAPAAKQAAAAVPAPAVDSSEAGVPDAETPEASAPGWWRPFVSNWSSSIPYALFGLLAGMAVASKISAAPLVFLLPAAGWLWWLRQASTRRAIEWKIVLRNLGVGALLALLSFRIFMPYAFSGPGFLGILPSQKWIDTIKELLAQTNGDVDAPFALQWIRRPFTFAWNNMVEWGMGAPLGLLAWGSFLWMGWRMLKGEWRRYLILWVWTGAFFVWQSLQGNPSMRYQLPVYPSLAIIAAWGIQELWSSRSAWAARLGRLNIFPWRKVLTIGLGVGVLGATLAWAFAFVQIYQRPVTRVAATQWIYQNVPGPINLHYQTASGPFNQPVAYPYDTVIQPGQPYSQIFSVPEDSAVSQIQLPALQVNALDTNPVALKASLTDRTLGNAEIGSGELLLPFNNEQKPYFVPLKDVVTLLAAHSYGLQISVVSGKSTVSLTAPVQFQASGQHWVEEIPSNGLQLKPGLPSALNFTPTSAASLQKMSLQIDLSGLAAGSQPVLTVAMFENTGLNQLTGSASQVIDISSGSNQVTLSFDPAVPVEAGHTYSFAIDVSGIPAPLALSGPVQFSSLGQSYDLILPYPVYQVAQGKDYFANFTAAASGTVSEIYLPYAVQQDPAASGPAQVTLSLTGNTEGSPAISTGSFVQDLSPQEGDLRGGGVTVQLNPPASLVQGKNYFVQVRLESPGLLALRGSSPANESTWDDGLPLRMDGYDGYGGLYQKDLRFEMYWGDDAAKVERFSNTLDQSDYIFITSNRQWGTIPRVQERYPLSTAYYRQLLGCPPEKDIFWCYAVAEPGTFKGTLGFDLVQVYESYPNLGPLRFNTQFAEEAFTVYDAPKVMIFRKSAAYSSTAAQSFLNSVDISQVVPVTPKKAPSYPANLMLPDNVLAQQQAGGTWSELFNLDALFNQYPGLAVVIWYLAVALLGLSVYPLTRLVFGRLADHGYPIARTLGMVLLAYIVWMAGSNGIPFTRTTIWLAFLGLLVVNAGLFYLQRSQIREDWNQHRRYYVVIELVMLAFFAIDLFIRLGNPDLWHPAKGGEKPMDFSYLNAVLKSTSFPPYDPWYAGGYINYYYYGFVLVGVLIKGLGIVPSVAYNLFLPTLFALVAMGAFSVGWNLFGSPWREGAKPASLPEDDTPPDSAEAEGAPSLWGLPRTPLLAGVSSAVAILLLGNLGTVKMIWEGFQRLVVAQDVMDASNIFQRMVYTFQGFLQYLGGANLPYGVGEWYWNPSRAIGGNTITEFPFFTFLYGDPHAHLIALPFTLLALVWAFSILKGRWEWSEGRGVAWGALRFCATLFVGGLVIGVLRPTNTWDMPAYLGLGALAVFYSGVRYGQIPGWGLLARLGGMWRRILAAGIATLVLVGLAFVLYQPFASWYGQAYTSVEAWNGDRSPMWAYTMHWGVFLFILFTWFLWETVDWMRSTPVSALSRLKPYTTPILAAVLVLAGVTVFIQAAVPVAWIPIVMAVWAALLLFRPGQPDSKKAVLVMSGLGLVLTLAVEVVVLKGDVGRMNTVFKFYLQAWTLFSLSAAAALWWMLPAVRSIWTPGWQRAWQIAVAVLVFGAALNPILSASDKIHDRMSPATPLTLDGMEYMQTSTYADKDVTMALIQDYDAIRWMQLNIQGSPVIVEANTPIYHWGSRMTIYTGLPGVLGWDWHEMQQRALNSTDWVKARVDEITSFYTTTDLSAALKFLKTYNVRYIILGQQELAYYPGPGLDKFAAQNGKLWREVYHQQSTTIYEVIQ